MTAPAPGSGYDRIPVRELRNNVSDVLRRVESGQTFEITVNDRPVALLTQRPGRRPRFMSKHQLLAGLKEAQADPALRDQLAELKTETTDDMPDPWERYG